MSDDAKPAIVPSDPVGWLQGVAALRDADACSVDAAILRGLADEIERLRKHNSELCAEIIRLKTTENTGK